MRIYIVKTDTRLRTLKTPGLATGGCLLVCYRLGVAATSVPSTLRLHIFTKYWEP